jgi:DNA-binding MarR family transcriptional regulator
VANQALIAFTRERLAEVGCTQPQYWVLRNLSEKDLSVDGRGMTVAELRQVMRTYLRAEDEVGAEVEVLVERGWVRRDGAGRLWITEAGEEARVRVKAQAPAIRERIHEGVDDADYVIALKVLQRMIRNTGGLPPA